LGLLNAAAILVANQGGAALASGRALAFHAFGSHGHFATGQAVQLDTTDVIFLIRMGALRLHIGFLQRRIDRFLDWQLHRRDCELVQPSGSWFQADLMQRHDSSCLWDWTGFVALGFRHALAILVPQIAVLAEASLLATQGATWRVGPAASRCAVRTAGAVLLIVTAFLLFFLGHGSQDLNLNSAFGNRDTSSIFSTDVAFFAEAALVAAQGAEHGEMRLVASGLAEWTAGAVLFIGAAFLGLLVLLLLGNGHLSIWDLDRNLRRHFLTKLRANTRAIGRFQISVHAEATFGANQGAGTWFRMLASWGAQRATFAVFRI